MNVEKEVTRGVYNGRSFVYVQYAEVENVTTFEDIAADIGHLTLTRTVRPRHMVISTREEVACHECGAIFSSWEAFTEHDEPPTLKADKPLVGYRIWRYESPIGGFAALYSQFERIAWSVGRPVKASCTGAGAGAPAHVPAAKCGCGFYAYSTYEAAKEHLKHARGLGHAEQEDVYVLGAVKLWGKVRAGRLLNNAGTARRDPPGFRYRSEWAQVVAFEMPEYLNDNLANLAAVKIRSRRLAAKQLSAQYGIPTYPPTELKLIAQLPDAGTISE